MKIESELKTTLKRGTKEQFNRTFEKIYKSYFKLTLFIARQYLDEHSAQEVVEDAFVSFFQKIIDSRSCDIDNIKQYLCTSVKNNAIRESNKRRTFVQYDDELNYGKNESLFLGEQLLEELNSIEQYIITEHVLLDRTFKEIASEIGKSVNTVKSIYRRGCQKARRRLTWVKK